MRLTVSRWLIEADPLATGRCYAQLPVGMDCTCCYCRNFDAARGRTFPAEFVALLETLGVDPAKPAELCHWCREPSGWYRTGGWFHCVGTILSGEDAIHWEGHVGTCRLEEWVPGLELGFTNHLDLVREVFAGLPLVQLEFVTRVPWVLEEPEPEDDPV